MHVNVEELVEAFKIFLESCEEADDEEPASRITGEMICEVFKRAVRAVTGSVENALAQAGISAEDIDVVLPHQANIRIIEAVTQRLGIPMEKTFNVLEHTGNTSGASIPMAMAAADEAGVLEPGAVVLMSGFGAGMAWGSVVVTW